jgi:hypothetical protein
MTAVVSLAAGGKMLDILLTSLHFIVGLAVFAASGAVVAILYQYFMFNVTPAGTRALPSPTGRLPLVGHRYLTQPVRRVEMELM